jgi:hypothetical protein
MNYNNEKNENSFYLKDLCIYILRKWRALIVAMLVGAALLGVYKGLVKPNTAGLSAANAQVIQDQIDKNNDTIATHTLSILENNNKIDLAKKKIETDQADIEVQNKLVSNLEEIIAKYKNAGPEAIESLVSANIQLSNTKQKIYDDEIELADLQKQSDYLPKLNESLQKKIDVLNKANEPLISSLTPQYFETGISTIIEYGILGAILGFLIVAAVAFLEYMMGKKLRNANELKEKYSIRIIGSTYNNTAENKHHGLDVLLDKWSGFDSTVDMSKQYKLIASAVQVMSSNNNNKIILTGTVDVELINQLKNKLSEYTSQDGQPICVVTNPVYDADALLQIKSGTVVLVEEANVSNKHEIEKLISILHAGKAEIVGAVML